MGYEIIYKILLSIELIEKPSIIVGLGALGQVYQQGKKFESI
jgi:hypothetical protein